jgi:hypothetical protein
MRFKEGLVEMARMRVAKRGAFNVRIKVVFKTTFRTPRLGYRSGSFMEARLGTLLGVYFRISRIQLGNLRLKAGDTSNMSIDTKRGKSVSTSETDSTCRKCKNYKVRRLWSWYGDGTSSKVLKSIKEMP